MNPLQLIMSVMASARDRSKPAAARRQNFNRSKKDQPRKQKLLRQLKDTLLLVTGVLSAGFGLESFLLPNSFIDGGVTGISLLVAELTRYPLPLLILIINIPFVIIGFTQIGRSFAIKSMISITALALAITFIHYPVVTSDKLLVAVFGGFFIGAGIGFAIRGGGVLDGTEVLAIYLSRKTGRSIGDIILVLNLVIFSIAAYVLSIESALYSILTYLAASRTVDFVVAGVEEYTGVTIISTESDQIKHLITSGMGRGVTVYYGKSGMGKRGETTEMDIVYTVITRLEIAKLNAEIASIDPDAFIIMSAVKDLKGGLIKQRPLH